MSGYVAGVAFIVVAVLLYAIALRAAHAAHIALTDLEPPEWVNDAPPVVIISIQELVDELNIALWEHELAGDE